jgi:tryptophanyl-tRNA synthetase
MSSDAILEEAQKVAEAYNRIRNDNGYKDVPQNLLGSDLRNSFFCGHNLDTLAEADPDKTSIVTGFGAVSSPTAGTLSMILKAIALQKQTGCHTEIIISDLGAFVARPRKFEEISLYAKRYETFIESLGFDTKRGTIRTQINQELLSVCAKVQHELNTEDYDAHQNPAKTLYQAEGIRSNNHQCIASAAFTVSDIIKPLFNSELVEGDKGSKDNVLVIMGIDEHYFPKLAEIAVQRIQKSEPDIISQKPTISAAFTKLIKGFYPYPKMSKSQPESSLNVGDSIEEIKRKILQTVSENQEAILGMMTLASTWTQEEIAEAKAAFEKRDKNPNEWQQQKAKYLDHFMDIAKKWKLAEKKHPSPFLNDRSKGR